MQCSGDQRLRDAVEGDLLRCSILHPCCIATGVVGEPTSG